MSIISKSRELLKNLKTGASSAWNGYVNSVAKPMAVGTQPIQNYFNPTSNNGQNFWSRLDQSVPGGFQAGAQRVQNILPQLPTAYGNYLRTGVQQMTPKPLQKFIQPIANIPIGVAQGVAGMANNSFRTGMGSANKMIEAGNIIGPAIKTGDKLKIAQGLSKAAYGIGNFAAVASPLYQGSNFVANQPQIASSDALRRVSSGITQGMGGIDSPNVPSRNVKILGMEFDPLQTVGQMIGFVKNPTNVKLFGQTQKLIEVTKNMNNLFKVGSLVTKGGIEGLLQSLGDLPEKDRAKYLSQQIAFGSASEVGFAGVSKVAGKVYTALKPFIKESGEATIKYTRDILGRFAKTISELKGKFPREVDMGGKDLKFNPVSDSKLVREDPWKNQRGFINVKEIGKSLGLVKEGPQPVKPLSEPQDIISPATGKVNGKLPQPVEVATTKPVLSEQSVPIQSKVGDMLPSGRAVSSSTPIIQPYAKEVQTLIDTKPVFDAGEMDVKESATFVKKWNTAVNSGALGKDAPKVGYPEDPIGKITKALLEAKPLEAEQGKIYSQMRSKQAGALSGIGEQMGGESGYFKKLGQLKGEMPKVQFESIRKNVTQSDINEIFNRVEKSNLSVFEKVSAQGALTKLLGAKGGSVPTNSELKLLNEVFPPEFIQAVLQNRSAFQKALSLTEGFLNLPRAVMATADLSAPLRQGIFLIGRPKQWIPAFRDMFKYAFNENSYKGLAEEIKASPNAKLYREAKLAITDNSPVLGSREEAFMSNLTERIPVFGKLAAGSNRAYSGFLNKLRVNVFDDLVNSARKQGLDVSGKTLEDIGSFVNSATGRGSLPKFIEKSAPLLNATFFSPRLMASRINLLNPVYYAKLDPFVRKEALKSLLTFGATAGTVLGLSSLAGADVETDPRSADFGKIKVGNTRYDVLGGFQQYIRLAAQLVSGQIVSSTTGKIITLGEGYKPMTRKDILLRFFENKTSPVASFVIGLATGTNSIGDKFNVPAEVINRFIPMVAQDVYDLQKEWGPKGYLMALPGLFGAGSQTYGSQELIKGKNQLGEPTSQLKSTRGLNEVISDKVFGAQPLGTTAQYSADAYYKELLKLPPQEAAKKFDEIRMSNPDIAKKIVESAKNYKLGVTPDDETIKMKGVASGDRAIAITKQFKKLKTPQEKAALWDRYVKLGIITTDVAKQLKVLLSK